MVQVLMLSDMWLSRYGLLKTLMQCDENPTPRKGYDSGDNSSLHFVQSLKMAQWLLRKISFNFHTHKTLTLNTYKP